VPKIERLSWLAPLSEGRGITLSDVPAADLLLVEDSNALLLGVLYDSQYATRKAFAIPLKLKERLGHLDLTLLAQIETAELQEVFARKPALHRFPYRNAGLTQQVARAVINSYGGDASRVWKEARDVEDLGARLLALPAFGVEKTNWTVGMLGTLGMLSYDGWDGFQASTKKRKPENIG
jgi:uncharacterized HhH-GPD family protein